MQSLWLTTLPKNSKLNKYHSVSAIGAYCPILIKKSREYSNSMPTQQKPTLLFSEPALDNSKYKQQHRTELSRVSFQWVLLRGEFTLRNLWCLRDLFVLQINQNNNSKTPIAQLKNNFGDQFSYNKRKHWLSN